MAVVSYVGECCCALWGGEQLFSLIRCTAVFFSPIPRPALVKFKYEPTHFFSAVLLYHMVGGLFGGWVAWPVGG